MEKESTKTIKRELLMGIILAVPILLVLGIIVDELYIKKKKAARATLN